MHGTERNPTCPTPPRPLYRSFFPPLLSQPMLFGGAISDMMQMAQVKRSIELVQGMLGQVRACLCIMRR